jgi:diacylglycerol kinase (ATP)
MLKTFKYALNGIAKAFATQRNMQIHGVALIVVIVAGFYFHISLNEWIAVILCSAFVFSAEIMNTAIEEMVNFISPEKNPKAGLIKDLSAGAVLITAIAAVIVAAIIFVPKIF